MRATQPGDPRPRAAAIGGTSRADRARPDFEEKPVVGLIKTSEPLAARIKRNAFADINSSASCESSGMNDVADLIKQIEPRARSFSPANLSVTKRSKTQFSAFCAVIEALREEYPEAAKK